CSAQHRFLIVLEIRVDLGLGDLAADLLRRIGLESQHAQPIVDRVEVRAVVLLLRGDIAVRLALPDQYHDLPILDRRPTRRGELLPDAIFLGLLVLLLLEVRGVRLRKLEPLLLRERRHARDKREQYKRRKKEERRHTCESASENRR